MLTKEEFVATLTDTQELQANLTDSVELSAVLTDVEQFNATLSSTQEFIVTLNEQFTYPAEEGEIMKYYTAGVLGVGAYKAVYLNASGELYHYDCSDEALLNKCIGVTLESGNAGEQVQVKQLGTITNDSWSFTRGAVLYAGLDGDLVEQLPTSAVFEQELAIATDDQNRIIFQHKDAEMISAPTIKLITAGENLNGHRVVLLNSSNLAVYADSTNVAHCNKVYGITTQAITSGDTGYAILEGEFSEPSWNWDVSKDIFFTSEAVLTQTPPSSGFMCSVGYPITPTKIYVTIDNDNIIL